MQKAIATWMLAAGIAACCSAQVTAVKGGYLFRVRYTTGQVLRFETKTTFGNKGSAGAGMTVQVPITLRVLSVAKGVATTSMTMGAGVLNGQPYGKPQTLKVPLDSMDSSSYGGPKFSPKPVKIGGTWEAVRPFNLGGQTIPLNGLYRFQGTKTVDGEKVAVVAYDMKGAANGTGTVLFLMSDASIYRNEMSITVPKIDPISQFHVIMMRLPEPKVAHKTRR
jgi:hypothetical protein